MRGNKRAVVAGIGALLIALGTTVSAHRLDEFLQATRIAVARDAVQLEMSLTPGASVADDVLGEVDTDRNGVLSADEAHAYAGQVLAAMTLRVDDGPSLRLRLADLQVPDVAALRSGDGAIVIRSIADVPPLAAGSHRLVFDNRNRSGNSVYLANALVPEDVAVAVTGQQRTGDQRELTIEFAVRDTSASAMPWLWMLWIGIGVAGACLLQWRSRTGSGLTHH